MINVYALVGLIVGLISVVGVFIKMAYNMGRMAQQLQSVAEAIEGITKQITELFEWRYQSAIRSQKGRGGLSRDQQGHGGGEGKTHPTGS